MTLLYSGAPLAYWAPLTNCPVVQTGALLHNTGVFAVNATTALGVGVVDTAVGLTAGVVDYKLGLAQRGADHVKHSVGYLQGRVDAAAGNAHFNPCRSWARESGYAEGVVDAMTPRAFRC